MTTLERAQQILMMAKALNQDVRMDLDTISLHDAKELASVVNDAKGWLEGIHVVLALPPGTPNPTSPDA